MSAATPSASTSQRECVRQTRTSSARPDHRRRLSSGLHVPWHIEKHFCLVGRYQDRHRRSRLKFRGTRPVVLKMLLELPLRMLYPTNTRHEAVLHRIQSHPPGTETRIERNDSRGGKNPRLEGVSYSPRVDEGNRDQHEAKKNKCPSDELRGERSFRAE